MKMIDKYPLRREFNNMRGQQGMKLKRWPLTPTDHQSGGVVFESAWAAASDVKAGGGSGITMRAVSLGTGTGKSNSAYAFIAAACRQDRTFSAAYFAPTIKMALAAQQGIEMLLGYGSTVLWSSHHDVRGQDAAAAQEDLGFVPDRLVDKSDLTSARVIVVTHKLWKESTRKGKPDMVTHYKGNRRDVLFVDESPDLVELVECRTPEVQEFLDMLDRAEAAAELRTVLAAVISRMNTVALTTGQTYSPENLVSAIDMQVFAGMDKSTLKSMTDGSLSETRRGEIADRMMDLLEFLHCSSRGCCFYSRLDRAFFTYRLDFATGPGHVLLDATSDLSGLVTLNDSIEEVATPEVNYENLTVLHVEQPKEYRRIADVTKSAAKARPYADWIKETVLANTKAGDDVLVITHLAMLAHQYLPDAGDVAEPVDWHGRKVNTLHWGGPWIGLNDFKDKTHVFCFSEFYQKRTSTIGEAHGWSGKPLDHGTLKLAEGRRVQGDEFAPQGIYRTAYEGHLLRWTKQMAMRGRARHIDKAGKAAPMVLVTSMAKGRLSRNFKSMFPGAKPFSKAMVAGETAVIQEAGIGTVCSRETAVFQEAVTRKVRSRGFQGLADLLETTTQAVLGADQVEAVTSIRQCDLTRAFGSASVAPIASLHSWRLVAAKDIGRAGRMKHLVNDRRLVGEAKAKPGVKTLGDLLRA